MGINKRAIKAMFPRDKWRVLRGDTVYIAAGRDKGQTGVVTKVIRDRKIPKAFVEGRNLNKRFIKRTKDNPGGVVSVESPIHYSNLRLIDPVTKSPVRASFRFLEDGSKVRVSRGKLASDSVIPRPDILKERRKPLSIPGPRDTAEADVKANTYVPQQYPEQWLSRLRRSAATVNIAAQARQHCTLSGLSSRFYLPCHSQAAGLGRRLPLRQAAWGSGNSAPWLPFAAAMTF